MEIPKLKRVKVSKRMNLFLEYSLKDQPFWDLCCDHGMVGLGMLVFKKTASHVYMVDCVPHIMDLLQKRIDQLYIKPSIPFTLYCLNAQEISIDVEGVVLIAGVGGLTIKKILHSLLAANKLKAKRLLLSPHTDIMVLENYFSCESFCQLYQLVKVETIIVGKKEKPLFVFDYLS